MENIIGGLLLLVAFMITAWLSEKAIETRIKQGLILIIIFALMVGGAHLFSF